MDSRRPIPLMPHWRLRLVSVGMGALLAAPTLAAAQRGNGSSSIEPAPVIVGGPNLPGLAFAENLGQWDDPARFVSKRRGAVLRAEPDALWIDLRAPAEDPVDSQRLLLRMSFVGASSTSGVVGDRPALWKQHYFLGRDPGRWRSHVPVFAGLHWDQLWPGITLVLEEGAPDEILAYRLELEPGADSNAIAVRVEGIDDMRVSADGSLIIETPLGAVAHSAPRCWEDLENGVSVELACRFRLVEGGMYGFEVDGRDASRPLRIDPGLVWATYLGGALDDSASSGVVRADGAVVVTGSTYALDFPTTPGTIQGANLGAFDAFVSCLTSDGSALVFSTYLGGSDSDTGRGVGLDSAGSIVVAGSTESIDYPVTPGAFDTVLVGDQFDAHVTKLSVDGSQLLFATYVGGVGDEAVLANVLIDPGGDIFFAGRTEAHDFPVTPGALFPTFTIDSDDGFLARVSADGKHLLWATYVAGKGGTQVVALGRAPDGDVVLLAWTLAPTFPTTSGAFDEMFDGPIGYFAGAVMKIGASGGPLVFSTLFEYGVPKDLDVDSAGRIALTGNAQPSLPVTPGAFSMQYDAIDGDSYAAILAPDGRSLPYATFLGGVFDPVNNIAAIDLAESGVITVMMSGYQGLPTTPGAFVATGGSSYRCYVTRLTPKGDALLHASYIGGTGGTTYLWDGLVDQDDRAIFLGAHQNGFAVTPGAFDTTYGGAGPVSFYGDGVLAKFELQPLSVNSFGKSTPSCKGPIRLHALGPPLAGSTSFAVACTGAPHGAFGFFALSAAAFPAGLPIAGVTVYLDLLLPPILIGKLTDSFGYAELPLPIPTGATGQKVALQSFWLGTANCGGVGSIGASDALRLSIQ